MDRLFVDTGAFIALFDDSDQYHALAAGFYDEAKRGKTPLLSTNCVLHEAYTWLQRKPGFGYPVALRFGDWFKGISSAASLPEIPVARRSEMASRIEVADPSRPFALLYADHAIEEEAWRFFGRHAASGATYTDCVSFAVMAMLGIERAFTFDEHFTAAGFVRVPGQ